MLQSVPCDPQADAGGHDRWVEEAEKVRQYLWRSADQSKAVQQLWLVQASIEVLCTIRPQLAVEYGSIDVFAYYFL